MTRGSDRRVGVAGAIAVMMMTGTLLFAGSNGASEATTETGCDLSDETQIDTGDLPPGSNAIDCDAVGIVVTSDDGVGLTVPEPGTIAGTSALAVDGNDSDFQIAVSLDGTVSYPSEIEGGDSSEAGGDDNDLANGPAKCADTTYRLNDIKAYSTYNWYIGDGGLPGGLSLSQAQGAFSAGIGGITNVSNNCGYGDFVGIGNSYSGLASNESGMDSNGNCGNPDDASVWDAGTLPSGTVARTCWWATESSPGSPNPLREADTQFNTSVYNFTNNGSGRCSNEYDIRSVSTHEAGHIFGLADVKGAHGNLTMYYKSFICKTSARNLAVGDIMGLDVYY